MNLEDLLIFVAVLVALYVNVVRPALKRRGTVDQPLPQDAEPVPLEVLPSEAPPATTAAPPARPFRRREALPFEAALAQAPAPRARPRRQPLGNRADLRRAVVARTVLGPCRALRPFGSERD